MLRDDRDRWMRIRGTAKLKIGSLPYRLSSMNYPTVYDMDEFERTSTDQALKQILEGKAVYSGLGDGQSNPLEAPPGEPAMAAEERIMAAFEAAYQRMKEPR